MERDVDVIEKRTSERRFVRADPKHMSPSHMPIREMRQKHCAILLIYSSAFS